ncbi:MAG: TatD family hydrolase [Candidatus Omnitrophica bacterium]|nr:TatD family hydrolase [Candidatus Omnitrophota bacterium]
MGDAMVPLIDAHCHLQDRRIQDLLGPMMERAAGRGVDRLVCCGSAEDDWGGVAAVKRQYPLRIIPSFGLHPWYIKGRSRDWLANLEGFLRRLPSGVGEIGLDFAVRDADFQEQRDVFVKQLELAAQLRRPVSIHCRRAWSILPEALDTVGPLNAGGVIHSYSGSAELIPVLQGYNLSFSFSCSITRSGNTRARRALLAVARDRLLIETDSPDIPPAGLEGPNEPSNLLLVAQTVAELLGLSVDDVAALTSANTLALYGALL